MQKIEGDHYLVYAFEMAETLSGQLVGGGLATTVDRQVTLSRAEDFPNSTLNILSPDNESMKLLVAESGVTLEILAAAEESIPNGDRFGIWFGDQWVIFHPDAHIADGGYRDDVLGAMFSGSGYKTPIGTLDRAVEHVENHGFHARNPQALSQFADRFDERIREIPDKSVINWQDYMFYPSMQRYAEELRARGCWQSYHHHVTVPEQLRSFSLGEKFLRGVSLMDQVFVHTDVYARRLEHHFLSLKLPVPEISRYDLGVDQVNIGKRLNTINRDNYQETEAYKSLTIEQRAVIDEIVSTQDTNLHRFVVVDRADQQKGPTVVLDGMDQFLSTLTLSEQEQFRFYLILPQLDRELIDHHPQHQYIKFLREKLSVLKEKYPKVLHYMPGIPPVLVSLVQRDAHAITGGIQDGLCLSPMETLKVNAITGYNRTGIIGMGTGFAMQTIQNGRHSHLINFVRQGSVMEMAKAIKRIVDVDKNDPKKHGRQTRSFVERVIDPRTDGVIVFP